MQHPNIPTGLKHIKPIWCLCIVWWVCNRAQSHLLSPCFKIFMSNLEQKTKTSDVTFLIWAPRNECKKSGEAKSTWRMPQRSAFDRQRFLAPRFVFCGKCFGTCDDFLHRNSLLKECIIFTYFYLFLLISCNVLSMYVMSRWFYATQANGWRP